MLKAALYDSDFYYANRVVSVLNDKFSDEIELDVLKEEELEEAMKKHTYPFLIVSDDYRDMAEKNDQPVLLLTKNRSEISPEDGNRIFAFSDAMGMYSALTDFQKMLDMYSLKDGNVEHAKLLVFASLGGGVGTTSLAAGMATYAVNKGKKVLYISTNPLMPTGYFEINDAPLTYRAVVADIEGRSGKLRNLLEQMPQSKEQVSVLSAADEKLQKIDPKELGKVIRYVDQMEIFDQIIISVNVCNLQALEILGGMAQWIVTALDGNHCSDARFGRLTQYMEQIDSTLLEKIKVIYNKFLMMPSFDENMEKRVIGGINYLQDATPDAVLRKMESMRFWECIL